MSRHPVHSVAVRSVVFRGGHVIDGTGSPMTKADVVVADGRIAAVGDGAAISDSTADLAAARVIDATGLVLAPGFIDMHAHSDLAVLTDEQHLAKTAQGVTLEVLGQDGLSYAPNDVASLTQLRRQLAGWNGDPDGLDWNWRTVGDYLDRIDRGAENRAAENRAAENRGAENRAAENRAAENRAAENRGPENRGPENRGPEKHGPEKHGAAVNAAYLVPQGTLRMMCVGNDDRPATPSEMASMRRLLAESLEQGAVGMSSGLTYSPGMYADTAELVDLCRVVARYGGYYSPHHRSYGAGALDAYAEMIRVAEESGCPVHLTHATMNFPVNAGRASELVELIDAAIRRGVDVTLDSYPYLPGATTLAALLPSWVASGGPSALSERLRHPADRARMTVDLEVTGSDGAHGVPVDWSLIQISGVRRTENARWVGLTVAACAEQLGVPATEFALDLLLADDLGASCLMHVGDEDNVRTILRHPAHLVGSDGLLHGAQPHPRGWGTFPRYLAHYVRAEGLLTIEECVASMTGRAARRLGLTDRGVIAPGLVADLVAFDPDTVADRATFAAPRRTPIGIPYVLINGEFVIDDGVRTAATPGRSIRRSNRR